MTRFQSIMLGIVQHVTGVIVGIILGLLVVRLIRMVS